jgi:exonuclease III
MGEQGQPRSETMSRRRKFIERIRALADDLRSNGREYKVIRGAVNWATWPFDIHPLGMAILVDESSLLRNDFNNEMALTLEMMEKQRTKLDEIDEGSMDAMYADAIHLLEPFVTAQERDPDDPAVPLVVGVDQKRDSAIEVSDATLQVQGVIVTVFLRF